MTFSFRCTPAVLRRAPLVLLIPAALVFAAAAVAAPAVAAATLAANADTDAALLQSPGMANFIDDMVAEHGFDKAALQATMDRAHYVDSAVQLVKPAPPGKPKNWSAYRDRFVEPVRIDAGVAFWNTYADALNRAWEQYGVPPEVIVAILGVETIYGRDTGNFRVMDAITTLAFAYPDVPNRVARMAYFRSELENTLLLARAANIDPFSLLGSYAGAIGLPQFMPGSIRRYAVDFDGDGKVDLRDSPVDAIGSVAHFLAEHGWRRGEPIAFPADVDSSGHWQRFVGQGLAAKYTLAELEADGVTPAIPPPADLRYGLVDLQNGDDPTDYWLGTDNFFAITQYNRSFFYAMSVNDLSRALVAAHSY